MRENRKRVSSIYRPLIIYIYGDDEFYCQRTIIRFYKLPRGEKTCNEIRWKKERKTVFFLFQMTSGRTIYTSSCIQNEIIYYMYTVFIQRAWTCSLNWMSVVVVSVRYPLRNKILSDNLFRYFLFLTNFFFFADK